MRSTQPPVIEAGRRSTVALRAPKTPCSRRRDTAWAMSEENVELVRAGIDAYNRRDLDAILQHMASDFVFDRSRSISLNRGVLTLDEFRRWMEEMWATFEVQRFEADEFIEAGESVVVPVTVHAEGAMGSKPRPTPQSCTRSATAPSLGWRCTTSCRRPSKPPGCRSRRLAAITGPPGAVMPELPNVSRFRLPGPT